MEHRYINKEGCITENRRSVNLKEASISSRNLLDEAEKCYNSGNYEKALLLFHKGSQLRPNKPEFKVGISKTRNALSIIFLDENKRRKSAGSTKRPSKSAASSKTEVKSTVSFKLDTGENDSWETTPKSTRDTRSATSSGTGYRSGRTSKTESKSRSILRDVSSGLPKLQNSITLDDLERNTFESQRSSSVNLRDNSIKIESITSEYQRQWIKAAIAARRTPIDFFRNPKYKLENASKEEVRSARVKLACRPKDNMDDDYQFLKLLNKNWANNSKSLRVEKITTDAIHYLDTRNKFWTQQVPHHIHERTLVIKEQTSKDIPLSVATIHAFLLKETKRIQGMMQKKQWYRTADKAKKLLEHIVQVDQDVANIDRFHANCCSILGTCYFELENNEQALEYHSKDYKIAKECELRDAKSRAMDNLGRVYARTGQMEKAIAIWEKKLSSGLCIKKEEEAWLRHQVGYCYIELGEIHKAKENGQLSLKAAVELNDKPLQLNALILIAQALLKMGQASKSREQFHEALLLAQEIGDTNTQEVIKDALLDVKKFYDKWGDVDDYKEAGVGKDPTKLLEAELKNILHTFKHKKYPDVVEEGTKFVGIVKNIEQEFTDKEKYLCVVLQLMGNSSFSLGQHEKALKYYSEGLGIGYHSDIQETRIKALAHMGRSYARTGEYTKAISVWDEMAGETDISPFEYSWLYYEKGYCYIETGYPELAKYCGEKLFDAAIEKGDVKWELNSRLLIAQSLLSMGEAFMAREAFQDAIKLAKESKSVEAQNKIDEALKEINDILLEYMQHERVQIKDGPKKKIQFEENLPKTPSGKTSKENEDSEKGQSVKFKDMDECTDEQSDKVKHTEDHGQNTPDITCKKTPTSLQRSKSASELRCSQDTSKLVPLKRGLSNHNIKQVQPKPNSSNPSLRNNCKPVKGKTVVNLPRYSRSKSLFNSTVLSYKKTSSQKRNSSETTTLPTINTMETNVTS